MHLIIPFPTYSIYQSKHCVLLGNMVKQNKNRIGFSFQSHTIHNKIRRNRNQGIFMHFVNFYQTNRLWLWYNIKLSLKKREKILVCGKYFVGFHHGVILRGRNLKRKMTYIHNPMPKKFRNFL